MGGGGEFVVTRMFSVLPFFLISVWSSVTASDLPISCSCAVQNGPAAIASCGDFTGYELGEAIAFEAMVRNSLETKTNEIQRVLKLSAEHRGPDQEYIPRLIELFDSGSGALVFTCLWEHYTEGDTIQKFTIEKDSEIREGHVIIREGRPVAYMYTVILNV